ncbi:MAG: type II toxin-antitoxin system VapC family toxin [Chloroflexi bacterium]|nr:type II toxin-antitoxin system VapC family toxin [Chloroflexota bacterium]
MRFIDTNLFLRYFTSDHEPKDKAVLELLKKVERNEEQVITTPLVIFETVFTLQSYYKVPRDEIRDLLDPILSLRGLRLEMKETVESALELYASQKSLSFADAFSVCYMRKKGLAQIYSFDADFDKIEGIERIEP